jgi:hypothetical protein
MTAETPARPRARTPRGFVDRRADALRAERAIGWLAELRLPARLVRHDGAVVTVAGWP